MGASEQARLGLDLGGHLVDIQTSGRVIKPLLAIPDAVCDEFKLHVEEDGLRAAGVDAASVAVVRFHAPADAFEEYDVAEPGLMGVHLPDLTSALAPARIGKRTDDEVQLGLSADGFEVGIERTYDDVEVHRATSVVAPDPDSIRDEAEIPDLDLSYAAEVPRQGFTDAIDFLDGVASHTGFRADGQDLLLESSGKDDDQTGEVRFEGVLKKNDSSMRDGGSRFSMDYLELMADALTKAKVGDISLRFGDEFPGTMEFERRVNNQLLYEGEFVLAPRISNGGA